MRTVEKFRANVSSYLSFPFETMRFEYRFELSHFELGGHTYRFDMHYSPNQFNVKEDIGIIPGYEIDFKSMRINILEEHKTHKDDNNGKETKCRYYPLCTFTFEAVRDPRSKIFSMFFPTALLGA